MWGVFPEDRVERTFYLASTGGGNPAGVSSWGKTDAAAVGSDDPERCDNAQSVSATP